MIGQTGDILGHNIYAYCQNNPVMYEDPSGHLHKDTNLYLFNSGGWGGIPTEIGGIALGIGIAQSTNILLSQVDWDEFCNDVGQLAINIGLYSKSKTTVKYHKLYEKHHIVEKGYKKGYPPQSRDILKSVHIDINSPHNLVYLEHDFHKGLHTNRYHKHVYDTLKTAHDFGNSPSVKRALVEAALMELRLELLSGDTIY